MKIAKVLKGTLAAVVLAGSMAMAPAAHAGVFLSVAVAPPAIPVYAQPVAPGYGYIWTPGYWAYGPDGYYWVDGAWVYPPYEDALWTPGYWGWDADLYYWHPGYWGRTVGYYGGINYGFGYFGTGFYGGYWNGGHFFYNSAYNRVAFRDHDHDRFVYNQRVNGFDGRPGGAAFVHDDHARGDFSRGGAVNGRDFNRGSNGFADHGNANAFAGRGNEQVNFRNGYAGNEGRTAGNNGAAFQGNAGRQNFDGGRAAYNGNAGRQSFNGGAGFAGRSNPPAAAPAPQSSFNGGGHFNAPQGNFNAGSRGGFSAPQGNFGGGGHVAAPQGGGGHVNFGGGGFHGGGGGFHGGGGGRR